MQVLAENTVIDGRYRVLSRLGAGGMADVYCAEDSHLGRKVAVKLLYRRFAEDREFVERFRREASAAAGLQHPNVVNVFDRGEHAGTYYIAMEYLPGESLKTLIGEGLTTDQAVGITRQILSAARFAHRHGVIHRDLKPHNVIVDSEGRAKVTDFGIARAGTSEMTQAGSIIGTAQYLSPEQAQGLPVTGASDLYSVGVILYEALTGAVPFDGDSAVTVALKQVSEAPVPPSQLNPDVPPALEAVVLRALAKRPEARYADADEFLADLEYAAAHPDEPLGDDTAAFAAIPAAEQTRVRRGPPAPPPWQGAAEAESDPGRRRWPWLAGAAVVVVAAALLAFALLQGNKVEVPRVIGLQAPAATQLLEDRGFDVDIRAVRSGQPPDTVLEQDPTPGSKAADGSTVILTVSTGPGTARVPRVAGLEAKSAERRLKRRGFVPVLEREFSSDVEKGKATRTEPAAGVEVKRGQRVRLYVSRGAEEVRVPDVVGLSLDAAEARLRDAGLVPRVVRKESNAPEDEVLRQTPGADERAKRRSEVTLVVSKGEGTVAVPSVVGRSAQGAADILSRRGLRVSTLSTTVDQISQDGKVVQQSPGPGERARRGDAVTISVGRFEPPPPDEQQP
jgi:eukaryotic-like serine/threonine-protein kinase